MSFINHISQDEFIQLIKAYSEGGDVEKRIVRIILGKDVYILENVHHLHLYYKVGE